MFTRNREFFLALLAILLISLLYLAMVMRLGSIPEAQSFFGHSLGVLGFTLMVMTELLYSIRKRSRSARWGRLANWLRFHIFTGLVGPYMVLLHSAWQFNGLAGVVLLLTLIIVVSGFIGRYIYTAVPRTADGAVMQAHEINEQIHQLEESIQNWMARQPQEAQALHPSLVTQPPSQGNGPALVLGRALDDLTGWLAWQRTLRRTDPTILQQQAQMLRQFERLLRQRKTLHRQMESLATARRLLAIWHTIHIPIGMALFTASLIHIAAAIYFATLLH